MFKWRIGLSAFLALTFWFCPLSAKPIDDINIIVPGGQGGGWDLTARVVADVLRDTGLALSVTIENFSGGGGARAMESFIEKPRSGPLNIMVQSAPLVLRGLSRSYKYTWRDLTPIAALIGDYQVIAVKAKNPQRSLKEIAESVRANPTRSIILGGSVPSGLDHISAAMLLAPFGVEVATLRYAPRDTGGEALKSFLASDQTCCLSTGYSEILPLHKEGLVRMLAVTGGKRMALTPEVPTAREAGADIEFINWRGFFAAPKTSFGDKKLLIDLFTELSQHPDWLAVLERNGWESKFLPDQKFVDFLTKQEREMEPLAKMVGPEVL